jgi:magnesium-transporting ATPase (P-type)
MFSRRWQRRAALFLLIAYSVDLAIKLVDWHETFGKVPWWGIALGLTIRCAFMGGVLFLYLKLRKVPEEQQPPMTKPMKDSALRSMRIVHVILCVAIVMYAYVAETVFRPTKVVPPLFVESFSVLCVVMVVIGLVFRRRLLPSASEGIQRGDAKALARWRQATVLSMVLALSVSLYGFALRAIGGSQQVVGAFFIAAAILMWVWRPQLVDGTSSTSSSE